MAKYFVLDKHLYKRAITSPLEAPQLDSRPPEPDRRGSGAARTLGAPGSSRHRRELAVPSGHLTSMAGLLCRLSCAGRAAKESGLVNLSLRPVLPQNTLSNS